VHEGLAFLIGRRLARSATKLIVDVQGDWRQATRLYGSRARQLLSPVGDRVGPFVIRRADGVRTLSPYTTALVRKLGIEPLAEFAPFVDSTVFLAGPPVPLPERPTALFVGSLERCKGFDTLAAAWPRVRSSVPDAVLDVVGTGTLESTARELTATGGSWTPALDAVGVGRAMDAATVLCLPSRSEGLGRVVLEAMCRGRAVVGADAGGIPDVLGRGVNALLVPPDDAEKLASALVRVLGDRSEAARLGTAARRAAEAARVMPDDFAAKLAPVVDAVGREHTGAQEDPVADIPAQVAAVDR